MGFSEGGSVGDGIGILSPNCEAGSLDESAWRRAGVLSILEDLFTVDKEVLDARGQLVRLLEGGPIDHRLRVEDHDVGIVIGCQTATTGELEIGGW